MADIAALQRQRADLIERIALSTAARDSALRAQKRAESDAQFALNATDRERFLRQAAAAKQEAQAQQLRIDTLSSELERVNQELTKAQAQSGGQVSTGETQKQAQVVNDDKANTQSPQGDSEVVSPTGRIDPVRPQTLPTNTAPAATPPTSNTNPPTKPASQTQTVPPATSQTPIQPGSTSTRTTQPPLSGATPSSPTPGAQPGAAAANDDNTNGVVSRINSIFGGNNARIVPQDNVLDQYSSYTYNISIYLTNSDEYRNAAAGKSVNLSGANLLMQSGGAPTGQRNQHFPLDFYIDDLSIRSVVSGKGSGGAHNAVSMSFKVFEPNGVTFLQRLAQAVKTYVRNPNQSTQVDNYAAQPYLMVIRFWGYDANGELVRVANSLQTPGANQEPGLIVEKYIPFRFTEIKFRLQNKVAEYSCEAACLRDYAPTSQTRGIIPYNIELTSVTLGDLLGVNLSFGTANQARDTQGRAPSSTATSTTSTTTAAQASGITNPTGPNVFKGGIVGGIENFVTQGQGFRYYDDAAQTSQSVTPSTQPSQSTAPPKATAAPRPNLVRGLTAALNEFQAELVRNQTYTLPDVYDIVINESILREALLQPPEAAAGLRSVPMSAAQSAGAQKLGIKQNVDRDNKNVAATAGMSIVQFLDQIVRNSSYIQDQQTKIYRKDSAGKWVVEPRTTGSGVFAWYRIGMDAVPIRSKGIDPKRGDYSYHITYTITPYQVNDSKSAWFPQSQFQGTHKKYEYWFTGLNSSIISYEQDYNYLYYIAINGGQGVPPVTSDYREYTQYAFQARAPEASQGAPGPVFDPAAQAAAALYSPGDTALIKMQIMGDPSWIQQAEIVSGVPELGQTFYGPFLPDSTINYDSREILFEVTFNTSGDYNLETGLMEVQRRNI